MWSLSPKGSAILFVLDIVPDDAFQQGKVHRFLPLDAEEIAWVKDTFPTLTPKIAWNQPMFTDHGTFIIGFSAAKQHFSVSPEVQGMTAFCDVITKSGYSQTSNLFRIQ